MRGNRGAIGQLMVCLLIQTCAFAAQTAQRRPTVKLASETVGMEGIVERVIQAFDTADIARG
jgi:hypothetical protein